ASTTTNGSGVYAFSNVPPASYKIVETQPTGYNSVSDKDGGNLDIIGDITPVVVTAGATNSGNNFVEEQPGSIVNQVWADENHDGLLNNGETGINGVLVRLDSDLNNDGDFADAGETGFATTTTSGNGNYTFANLPPGNYQVVIPTPPSGSPGASRVVDTGDNQIDNDNNGSQPVFGGPVSSPVLAIAAGENDSSIDFGFACRGTWEEWKFLNPLGGQNGSGGNPDGDGHDNLAEFAFNQPAGSGAGDLYSIRPSPTLLGTLEAVFTRPSGATENVTYYLEYAATLGTPTVWSSMAITPGMITVVPNGDCTESVTINDLETTTGLDGLNFGKGFVRIRAELDEVPSTGTDHISYTEVEGWKETALETCCRTYNIPFLRETVFTGTVDTINGVSGQTLNFTTSAGTTDLGTLLTSGAAFYLEVTSGDNKGHRFDIVSASGASVTLANDSNLQAATAPFNTLTGALPASLAGDQVVIRRHWTLGEVFPPAGFGATNDRTTADQVQLFADGQWIIYWLYDDGVLPPRWVKTGDNTYADQAATVLPPGQGLFFNNRQGATSVLSYGEVRENDFIRPLAAGSNLVGGGYPVDQSAAAATGRAMTVAKGFFGSRDFATADSFFVWKGDDAIGVNGYQTYFLNNNAPRVPSVIKWVKVGDASLLSRDAEVLLLGNRSVFIRSKSGVTAYTSPSPWTP
ncbi:MAG: SdrD B-like domain-containing protein, partial [Verrucomicrobiales bacterium]